MSDDEVVAVLPIDPMVEVSYFEAINKLPLILDQSSADLALLGARPTEPSSKFGYIKVASSANATLWYNVDSFVEKPEVKVAEQLIKAGSLWNCGVFCFHVGYIKRILTEQGYPTSHDQLLEQFTTLPKRSFDYEVVEKTARIAVLPYDGKWKDLGTWESMSSEMQAEFIGPGQSRNCQDTHVINELGIPVVTMGLKNTVVVSSPDETLVSSKPDSSGIKSIVESYGARPMFEERRWGYYRVLDYMKSSEGGEILTRSVQLSAGSNISYHKHMLRIEIWTITDGQGEVIIDSHIIPVQAGDVLQIHSGQWHAIHAERALSFIEVQKGKTLSEEDIIRSRLVWDLGTL